MKRTKRANCELNHKCDTAHSHTTATNVIDAECRCNNWEEWEDGEGRGRWKGAQRTAHSTHTPDKKIIFYFGNGCELIERANMCICDSSVWIRAARLRLLPAVMLNNITQLHNIIVMLHTVYMSFGWVWLAEQTHTHAAELNKEAQPC